MYQDWMENVPLDVNKNKSNSGCKYCEKGKIHNGNICDCCNDKRKLAGGYIWK